jgi:hypothetical protein
LNHDDRFIRIVNLSEYFLLAIFDVWLMVLTNEHTSVYESTVRVHMVEYRDSFLIAVVVFVKLETIEISCFTEVIAISL